MILEQLLNMTLEQLKDKFSSIVEMEGIGLNMYFLLKENDDLVLKRANIIESVKDNLISSYKNRLKEIVENEDMALLNISAADDRRSALFEYDLEEKPGVFDFFDSLGEQENQPAYFSFDNDSLNKLEGYFVFLGDHENNISLYRKQMPVNLFRQGKIYLIKGHNTQFTSIDQEFLRIDTKVDVIKVNDTKYVTNISILERHYEFKDIIETEAHQALANIEGLDILENIEILKERVSDARFARKLSKIPTSSPVFQLPQANIMSFVKGHLTLGEAFKYSDDKAKILLDTKKSQNYFLKLMNDDFLHSQLTAYDYLTPAKDKL